MRVNNCEFEKEHGFDAESFGVNHYHSNDGSVSSVRSHETSGGYSRDYSNKHSDIKVTSLADDVSTNMKVYLRSKGLDVDKSTGDSHYYDRGTDSDPNTRKFTKSANLNKTNIIKTILGIVVFINIVLPILFSILFAAIEIMVG